MLLFRNRILLEPATEGGGGGGGGGGPLTQMIEAAANSPAPASEASATPDPDLTATMPHADWSNDKTTSIDDFGPQPQTQPEDPKKKVTDEDEEDEQSSEAGEEAQGEGEVVEVQGTEEQVAPAVPQNKPIDPILERFPEAAAFSKKMDKNARENYHARLRDIIKLENEKTELSESLTLASKGRTKVPESYYENPHAYVLLPEYHQAVANVNLAAELKQHWLKQKGAVINGKDFTRADVVQDTNGQLRIKYSEPIKWSEDAIPEVEECFDHCASQLRELQRGQQSIEQGFATNVQQRLSRIKGAESELFPDDRWAAKDSNEAKMVATVQDGLKQLGVTPANPVYGLLAKTAAALLLERQYTAALQKQVGKKQAVASDARKAGPTGSFTVGGGGAKQKKAGGDDTDFSMDEFDKLLPQYGR